MIADNYTKKVKLAKQEAKSYLKTKKGYWFSSLLRVMFTLILCITTYSWFVALLLEDKLKAYGVDTANSSEHLLIILVSILGRAIMDYLIEQVVYDTTSIPIRFYLYRVWQVFFTTFLGVAGMVITILVKAPVFVGVLWFIVTFVFFITTKLSTFGSSSMYLKTYHIRQTYQKAQPKGLWDWKKILLFNGLFLAHDVVNIFTCGIYGLWYVPHKRATERFVFETHGQ